MSQFTQQPGFGVNTALVTGQLIGPLEVVSCGQGVAMTLACMGTQGSGTVEVHTNADTHIVNHENIRALTPGRLVSVTGRLDRITQIPYEGAVPQMRMVLIAETLSWTSQPHFAFTDARVVAPDFNNGAQVPAKPVKDAPKTADKPAGSSVAQTNETEKSEPQPQQSSKEPAQAKARPASPPIIDNETTFAQPPEFVVPRPGAKVTPGAPGNLNQPPSGGVVAPPPQKKKDDSVTYLKSNDEEMLKAVEKADAQSKPAQVDKDPVTGLPPMNL